MTYLLRKANLNFTNSPKVIRVFRTQDKFIRKHKIAIKAPVWAKRIAHNKLLSIIIITHQQWGMTTKYNIILFRHGHYPGICHLLRNKVGIYLHTENNRDMIGQRCFNMK